MELKHGRKKQKNYRQFAAYIGIDWADKKYDVCIQLADSDDREFSVLQHKPESIDEWARKLRERFGGQPVAVGLEMKKGPLLYALLKYDFLCLYPVNPQTLARYRRAFTTSRAKDDPTDAALLVELIITHRNKLQPWHPDDPETRKLQALVEYRRTLIQDRVRLTNRITSYLKNYFPQVLDWFPDKATMVFCDFLIKWPTLQKAKGARQNTLISFFRSHNSNRKEINCKRVEKIRNALPITDDPAIIESSAIMVEALVQQLKMLIVSIEKLEWEIKKVFDRHADAEIFSTLPGAGDALAPRLLVAVSGHLKLPLI